MRFAVIIPARYKSTRLPGKPLIDLNGTPMIIRTYNQCLKACHSRMIFVATDDSRIQEVCLDEGIQVLMTSSSCLTGTDRIAECVDLVDADVFINVQGDEPLFNPDDLLHLIDMASEYPGKILNGFCEITSESDFRNTSIPKVVLDKNNKLLYISRAPIPVTKNNSFVKAWRQVCAYVFPREYLKLFSEKQKKTPLEEIEDIEILRFLELGVDVTMIKLSADSIAVDLPEDVSKVADILCQNESLI